MARFFMSSFRWVILICLLGSLIHFFLNKKNYIFSPRTIRTVSEKYVGQHPTECLGKISNELRRQYQPHMLGDTEQQWLTISAGGMHGKLTFLHLSLTEYLAILGTPLKTSGHSGVHWMNSSCSVLTGSVQRTSDGPPAVRQEFSPGDHLKHYMFDQALLDFTEETWMLCYGRGLVPASGVYLTLGSLSSGDPVTPAKLAAHFLQAQFRETAVWFQETYEYYTKKR